MKIILVFLLVFGFARSKAQVVFCPPGAEWHYLFSGTIFWPGNTYNEKIKYLGDSINGLDTIKTLSHYRFDMTCGPSNRKTFIKQKGDTVFFYNNRTKGSWQILYNFATQPGQSWQTTIWVGSNISRTFTFTVQSVGTTTVNGLVLKQLTGVPSSWASTTITERIGSAAFLFNISSRSPGSCDGDVFIESLCYSDNIFGNLQFAEKPCDYETRNPLAIQELSTDIKVELYPNPVSKFLHIQTDFPGELELILSDVTGKTVRKINIQPDAVCDLGDLERGLYLSKILHGNDLIHISKIIKE